MLLFTSCEKEDFPKSTCRLESWQGLDDGYLRTHHYNEQGLTDQWHETNPQYDLDQLVTYEYDSEKHITRVTISDHNVLQSIVTPEYSNGRIIAEFWYAADFTALDTVLNTYNARGQIVKRESVSNAYSYIIEYDAIGNQTTGKLVSTDGTLLQTDNYAYDRHVLSPDAAIPGIPYPIQYLNYTLPRLKFNYLKVAGLDENGDFITFYELDPKKSTPLRAGPGGYAVYFNTFEKESQFYNRQVWHYQNCGCDQENNGQKFTQPAVNKPASTGKKQWRRFMTVPEMRERIIAWRKMKSK